MSFVYRITKPIRPQTSLVQLRDFAKKTEEWKTGSTLPLSLSFSSLKMRMEGGPDKKGNISNFGGIVKYADDSTNIRQSQNTTPLGKVMEDKQAILSPESNYMISLDPNISMWQHIDHSERALTPEKKAEICNGIHQFYQRRCESEKQTLTEEEAGLKAASAGTSIYSQIAKKTSNIRRTPTFDNVSNKNSRGLASDDEERGMHQRSMMRQQRGDENEQYPPTNQRRQVRQQGNEQMMDRGTRYSHNERMMERKFPKRSMSVAPEKKINLLERKNRNMRRGNEETSQEDISRNEMMEYPVYDSSSPQASPIYTTNYRCDDEPGDKFQSWQQRDKEEMHGDRKDKHHGKQGSYNETEDYDHGSYSSVTPPEIFKPTSGIAAAKMKFFQGNVNIMRKPNQYL